MTNGFVLAMLLFSGLFLAAGTYGVRRWTLSAAERPDDLDVLGHFGVAPARATRSQVGRAARRTDAP